jgi:hypothetical protein
MAICRFGPLDLVLERVGDPNATTAAGHLTGLILCAENGFVGVSARSRRERIHRGRAASGSVHQEAPQPQAEMSSQARGGVQCYGRAVGLTGSHCYGVAYLAVR